MKKQNIIILMISGLILSIGISSIHNNSNIKADPASDTTNVNTSANNTDSSSSSNQDGASRGIKQPLFTKNVWPPVLVHNYGMISKREKSHNPKYAYQRIVITFDSSNGSFYLTTLYYSKNKQYQHQSITKKGIKLNYFQYLSHDTFYLADGKHGDNNLFQFKFNTKKRSINMKVIIKNGKPQQTKYQSYNYVHNKKTMEKISN